MGDPKRASAGKILKALLADAEKLRRWGFEVEVPDKPLEHVYRILLEDRGGEQ